MVTIKRALVLGGGGARGSYEVGVWKALCELDMQVDVVTGTSVGALNGAVIAQGDMAIVYQLWQQIDTAKILDFDNVQNTNTAEGALSSLNSLAREAFRTKGVSSAPLAKLLRETIDEEKVRASKLKFGLVTYEVPAMKAHELFVDDIPRGMLVDYMIASASCFPAMHSYEIEKKLFIDGAYYDNLPVRLAARGGATEAVVVNLNTPGIVHKAHLKAMQHELIAPRWDLGALLLFDGSRAKRNITLGYNECMKRFGRYDGEKYTFYPGETEQNSLQMYSLFHAFFSRMGLDIDARLPRSLQGSLDAVPEYLAKYAVMRTAMKRTGKHALSTADIVTLAAESAGEILEVSPLEVYTFETFNLRVMNQAVRHARLPYSELGLESSPALSVRESIASITKIVSPVSPLNRMMYILSYLSDYEHLAENRRMITLLASALPDEFMAAVYIIALGSILKIESNPHEARL